MLNGKDTIIRLIARQIKKKLVRISEWVNFPEPKSLQGRVKVELNLTSYATIANLKNATGVDISSFV